MVLEIALFIKIFLVYYLFMIYNYISKGSVVWKREKQKKK